MSDRGQTFGRPKACHDRTVSEQPGGPSVADFDAVFVARYDALVGSLAVAFGDRGRAEEAVQEAFIRAYSRWRKVRRLEDPVGWIRRVAINLLIDESRRDARKERAMSRLAVLHRERSDDHDDAHRGDDSLLATLAALPRQQRTAASLYYLDELSVAEVAKAMGISPGAVKYHLHEARAALRRRYVHRSAS